MADRLYEPSPGVRDGMAVAPAAFSSLARPPGWKYEMWDGRLRLEPDWRHEVGRWAGPLPALPAPAGVAAAPLTLADEGDALDVADEAFATGPDFFGFPSDAQRADLARPIYEALRFEPPFAMRAHRIARTATGEAVGLLLVREVAGGVALNTVSVRPAWRGRGIATALLAEALQTLPAGTDVRSQWLLANRESAAWHARAGFVVIPTSVSAQSRVAARRFASGEGGWRVDLDVQRLQDAEAAGEAPDPFVFADPIHTFRRSHSAALA